MRVGVKYCDGCNVRYDRAGEFDKILAQFESDSDAFANDHSEKGKALFGFAKEGVKYDVMLGVCGCASQCINTDAFTYDKIITFGETGNVPAVVQRIKEYRDAEAAE